jgi:type IV pilus assembly protein PilN
MTRINLLPWRDELRKQQQKDFLTAILMAIGLTASIMLYVHFYIDGAIDYQQQRNRYLQSQVAILNKKITQINNLEKKKKMLIAKMEVIQRLQASRPESVHLFDELAKTIPDGVHIKQFTQSGRKLTFLGKAQSNARVSAYMRNLERSPWIANPRLNIIQTKGKSKQSRVSDFKLVVHQARPKPEKSRSGDNT